jgi:tRNA threonylcarbamoyl adenosine modification protein YeaZ
VTVTARGAAPRLLAIDTATAVAVVAIGGADGRLDASDGWPAGYRHGEDLLPRVRALLAARDVALGDLSGVIVGTGPGAFTGLRVGIATAKGIAHALRLPIAGVSSGVALLAAAAETGTRNPVLLLPAGPNDTVLVRSGMAPERIPGGSAPGLGGGETLVAVDLDGRAPVEGLARGEAARNGFAAALLRLGAERLREGRGDDLARLVPEYVTLPRGVAATSGEVEWSRDPR